jgi:hypothetical protein
MYVYCTMFYKLFKIKNHEDISYVRFAKKIYFELLLPFVLLSFCLRLTPYKYCTSYLLCHLHIF